MTARLRIEGATKRFGGVHALKGVDLAVEAGEIHALVGENGAGKSTLMKVLSGAIRPDDGAMRIDDDPYAPQSPRDARDRGVAMIYQELNLCPHLSVLQNVTLGAERSKLGFTVSGRARKKLEGVLAQLGIEAFGPDTRVGTLGPGDRQLVEIARALMSDARIIVFDEPTSSLSRPDVERLFAITRRLAAGDVSVIWISHFLDEIETLGERYTVLRDGRTVATGKLADTTTDELVSAMIGEAVDESALVRSPGPAGQTTFVVQGLQGERLPRSASFELRRGEVFGIFGLVGSGRTEMLRVLYGLDPLVGGTIQYFGESIDRPSPREWTARGVGLVSEDRAGEGLALDLSIATNVTLASASRIAGPLGTLTEARKATSSEPWTKRLKLRAAGPFQPVRALSGGNQQKVAIARLLHDEVDVLLLDEPTRGIDVGTKAEVVALIDELALAGNAVLVVTSYLPELMGLCDRIAVMYRGELGPARKRSAWTEDEILDEATRGVSSRDLQ